jgi:hypothetical protein
MKVGLPSECQLRVEADLRVLLGQSAAAGARDQLALSGLLGSGVNHGHGPEDLALLTRSGKLEDIQRLKACQLKNGRGFVGILSGNLRPQALRETAKRAPDKWRISSVGRAEVVSYVDQRPPVLFQTDDGSLLIASGLDELTRALSSPDEPRPAALPADGASLWARVDFPFQANANSPPGLSAAQSVLLRLDFASRKAEALVEFKPPYDTTVVTNQLRGLLTSQGSADTEAARGFAYVARRAIVSSGPSVIHIESELDDAAEAWFTDRLLRASSTKLAPPK